MLHCCVAQHVEHLAALLHLLAPLRQPLPKPDQRRAEPAGLALLRRDEPGQPVLFSLPAKIRQPLLCCTVYLKSVIHDTPLHIKRPTSTPTLRCACKWPLSAINDTAV